MPRECGEYTRKGFAETTQTGSSPLARGTLLGVTDLEAEARLIPARAGNIPTSGVLSAGQPAHPRSRGEHRPLITSKMVVVGSSPLARGTWPRYARHLLQ